MKDLGFPISPCEAFPCHLKLVRRATAKSVHELFAKESPLEEKKEMVFLTATLTVTVALAAPEGEQVKSPESERARWVTYQRSIFNVMHRRLICKKCLKMILN